MSFFKKAKKQNKIDKALKETLSKPSTTGDYLAPHQPGACMVILTEDNEQEDFMP